jgi:hypothetical protein
MATKKQKDDLMKALKFTPREIEITLYGYGGEIAMGRMSEAAYDYWQGRDDLSDYVCDWDGEFDEVPADARFCPDGSWYDIDDICHENGCEAGDGAYITVEDCLENRVVFESSTDLDALDDEQVQCQEHMRYRPQESEPNGTYVFIGQSIEKGTFFCGRVKITEPFDPARLTISYNDCDGWRLIAGVEYDGEEVEGHDAYSTTGKSTEFQIYEVENDQPEWDAAAELEKITRDMPVLEGEEMWASRMIDYADESERWEGHELSPWWDGTEKPVRPGRYQVLIGKWPFEQFAEWDGERWTQDGETVEPGIWRGLARDPG